MERGSGVCHRGILREGRGGWADRLMVGRGSKMDIVFGGKLGFLGAWGAKRCCSFTQIWCLVSSAYSIRPCQKERKKVGR